MSDSKLIDLTLELRHETARAYLVSDPASPRGSAGQATETECWLPKSLVEFDPTPAGRATHGHSDVHIFTMPEWLAQKEGLI